MARSGSSKLRVRRLRESDAGLYQCQALNVVGESERKSIDVVVVPSESEYVLMLIQLLSCSSSTTVAIASV